MIRYVYLYLAIITYVSMAFADPYIRYNQAGYLPDRPKSLVLISSTDLRDQSWSINSGVNKLLSGAVSPSISAKGNHTSHPFNHVVDFSTLTQVGEYVFQIGNQAVQIRISNFPYAVFITDALRHLKMARSGTDQTFNHKISHRGDSAAIVFKIDGDPILGKWSAATPSKLLDLRGGWYDAGDYIKFTLTIANTVYYLLEAWEANPLVFTKVLSDSELPDLLDEALHGLNYLMKVYPEPDLFVIQTGNRFDHQQGTRLPENDALDSKRPALCALSPVHMGLTAAALAKGARIFTAKGMTNEGNLFLQKACSIYARAQLSDALTVAAYEKDETNDFYRDNTINDNMALGAVELYKATKDTAYLSVAKKLRPEAGGWIGWGDYNISTNIALQANDPAAKTAALEDINGFTKKMDPVWGIPLSYTWGSLLVWNGAAATCGAWNRLYPDSAAENLHLLMVDYLFGRNNWGVSFLASTRLPNSVSKIYNQIYWLTDVFPQGAITLGPGDRATHSDMEQYFGKPPSSVLDSFQTSEAVFYDWEKDFMLCETVIASQSYGIWMLALGSDPARQASPDSSNPALPSQSDIDSTRTLSLAQDSWYLYSDSEEGGKSVANWSDEKSQLAHLEPKVGSEYPYAGIGFMIPTKDRNMSAYDGIILHGLFDKGSSFRFEVGMLSIVDFDYHGTDILGKGDSSIMIKFKDLSQAGFGLPVPFNSSSISIVNITYSNTQKPVTVRIDSVSLFRNNNHVASKKHCHPTVMNVKTWSRNKLQLQWFGKQSTTLRLYNGLGKMIWKMNVSPNEIATIPSFKGMNILTNERGLVLDRWVTVR